MKKFIFSFLFLVVSFASANEIQVFSSNTMDITLDKETKTEIVFSGNYKDYVKNQKTIFEDYFGSPTSLGNQAIYAMGLATAGALAESKGSLKMAMSKGGKEVVLATLGATALIIAGDAIYSSVVSDFEYSYALFCTNTKNETSIISVHIVANDKIERYEVERMAEEHILKKYKIKV